MSDKKKILFVCQYFYPEVFRGNDIAFHWAERGHDVHVVTGIPNYPEGRFHQGYSLFKKRRELIKGVRVTRLPIVPRGNNKIMLMLNYFSYFVVAWIYILFHAIRHKYDFVFVQQLSPVMMATPGVLYKRLRKVPLYTWVLDLWPESLSAAGGIHNKFILRFFDLFVRSEYKHSDRILTSSKSFEHSILSYGDYKDKIIYYPQWSDANPSDQAPALTTPLPDIPDGFVVMFAGAVGEAHGMECNLQAALMTKEYKEIKWVIVGDGRRLPWVQRFVQEHGLEETVLPLGRYESKMMPAFFEKADVLLVSLSDSPLFNLYAPAKISSYMASGKPIVACLNGEGAKVVQAAQCGWHVEAGNADQLAELVIRLSRSREEEFATLGENAIKYYEEYFDREKCLKRLDDLVGC